LYHAHLARRQALRGAQQWVSTIGLGQDTHQAVSVAEHREMQRRAAVDVLTPQKERSSENAGMVTTALKALE